MIAERESYFRESIKNINREFFEHSSPSLIMFPTRVSTRAEAKSTLLSTNTTLFRITRLLEDNASRILLSPDKCPILISADVVPLHVLSYPKTISSSLHRTRSPKNQTNSNSIIMNRNMNSLRNRLLLRRKENTIFKSYNKTLISYYHKVDYIEDNSTSLNCQRLSFIVKSCSDDETTGENHKNPHSGEEGNICYERLALELMYLFQKVFRLREEQELVQYPALQPYNAEIYKPLNVAIIEYIPGLVTLDSIKRMCNVNTLLDYFHSNFKDFNDAQLNFVRTLAGYSLFTYVLNVKDRHNRNILIDETNGGIVHVDFGYILGDSPGGNINFEKAPFKMTEDYIELLGGINSANYKLFQTLFHRGLVALQQSIKEIEAVTEFYFGANSEKVSDIRER